MVDTKNPIQIEFTEFMENGLMDNLNTDAPFGVEVIVTPREGQDLNGRRFQCILREVPR